MISELIPLEDIVDLSDDYFEEIDNLEHLVEERDIPSWILVSGRSSGENPTGYAWLGVVMSECSEESDGIIDTRVAVNTGERDVVKSNVGKIPDAILNPVEEALSRVENADICIARMQYDTDSMELESIKLYISVEEEKEE